MMMNFQKHHGVPESFNEAVEVLTTEEGEEVFTVGEGDLNLAKEIDHRADLAVTMMLQNTANLVEVMKIENVKEMDIRAEEEEEAVLRAEEEDEVLTTEIGVASGGVTEMKEEASKTEEGRKAATGLK
jgi:hypothetical protein